MTTNPKPPLTQEERNLIKQLREGKTKRSRSRKPRAVDLTIEEMHALADQRGLRDGVAVRDQRGTIALILGVGMDHKPHSDEEDRRPGFYFKVRRESGEYRISCVGINSLHPVS